MLEISDIRRRGIVLYEKRKQSRWSASRLRRSWSASLFSPMQIVGFLMRRLNFKGTILDEFIHNSGWEMEHDLPNSVWLCELHRVWNIHIRMFLGDIAYNHDNLSYFRVAMDIPSRKRNVAPSGQGGEDGDFVQLRVVREQVCTFHSAYICGI